MIAKLKTYWREVLIVVLVVTIGLLWYSHKTTNTAPTPLENPTIPLETQVTVVPKNSPDDPDVQLLQTYKAEINGHTVTAPINTIGSNGVTGVVKQEIDLKPVIAMQQQIDKQRYHKNLEVGVGLGVHEGDIYIPISIQRNYNTTTALEFEIHVTPEVPPRVNGAEIKYIKKF